MAGPTARVFDSLDGAQDCESLRSQMVLILLVQTPYFDNRHFKAKVFERTVRVGCLRSISIPSRTQLVGSVGSGFPITPLELLLSKSSAMLPSPVLIFMARLTCLIAPSSMKWFFSRSPSQPSHFPNFPSTLLLGHSLLSLGTFFLIFSTHSPHNLVP